MAFDLKVIRKKANKITEIETEIKKKKKALKQNRSSTLVVNFCSWFATVLRFITFI